MATARVAPAGPPIPAPAGRAAPGQLPDERRMHGRAIARGAAQPGRSCCATPRDPQDCRRRATHTRPKRSRAFSLTRGRIHGKRRGSIASRHRAGGRERLGWARHEVNLLQTRLLRFPDSQRASAPPYDDPSGVSPPSAFGTYRVLHQIGSGVLGPVFGGTTAAGSARGHQARQARRVPEDPRRGSPIRRARSRPGKPAAPRRRRRRGRRPRRS